MSYQNLGDTDYQNGNYGNVHNQPLLNTPVTVGPSATFDSGDPTRVFNHSSGNGHPFNELAEDLPKRLSPCRDHRVLLGVASLPGFYWEIKAVIHLHWGTTGLTNPLNIISIIGLAFAVFVVMYSFLIAIRALPISYIITSYHTDGVVLIPSELRSRQSIRKAIPFVACLFHLILSLVLCKLLVDTTSWDWHDKENQLLVGLACQHALCFMIASSATMKEFASGWEFNRYYSQNLYPNTGLNLPQSTGNFIQSTAPGAYDYRSNAFVAMSLTPRSGHAVSVNGNHLPNNHYPDQFLNSNLSGSYARMEGYIHQETAASVQNGMTRNDPAHLGGGLVQGGLHASFDHKYM